METIEIAAMAGGTAAAAFYIKVIFFTHFLYK
jgi:hypothetical protein